MATQLKKVVAPSGGDYTSLATALSDNQQDLVTNDKYFDIEISGDWSGSPDTTQCIVNGYTTDATRNIRIYTTGDAKHDGKWDTTAYILEYYNGDSLQPALDIQENYTTVTGLQVSNTRDADDYRNNAFRVTATNVILDKCIGKAYGSSYRDSAGADAIIKNSVFISQYRASVDIDGDRNETFYNCVFITIDAKQFGGVFTNSNTIDVTNCYSAIVTRSVGAPAYDPQINATTSASDDGTVSTSTVAYSTSSGAYFTNVTGGSEDFHITNVSSDFFENGTDLSGTFTDDIDGDTRTAWDIGIDYIVAGGVTTTPDAVAMTLTAEPPLLLTTKIAGTIALALTVEDPTITVSGTVYPEAIPLTLRVPGGFSVTVDDGMYDPIVTAGCPQCGTLLYDGMPLDTGDGFKAAKWRGRYDEDTDSEKRFVKCLRCGFICNTDRDTVSQEGSRSGWGMTYTKIDRTATG